MKIKDYQIFGDHTDTLKELSKDTSFDPPQYMTQRTDIATNFDAVKRSYTNSLGLSEDFATSCDALLFLPTKAVLIEFKNGKVKTSEVKTKIRDSLIIYGGITGKSIADTRNDMEFVLVYNECKNSKSQNTSGHSSSKTNIANHVAQRAKTEIILFDLNRFQTLCFRSVHTYTQQEFENYLRRNGLS